MSKTSSTISNVPEESWDPLTFLDQKSLKELINEKKQQPYRIESKLEDMSLDADNPKQKIYLKTDCVNEARFSALSTVPGRYHAKMTMTLKLPMSTVNSGNYFRVYGCCTRHISLSHTLLIKKNKLVFHKSYF
jgi:hypothetical protein